MDLSEKDKKPPLRERDLLMDAGIVEEFPELQPLVDKIRGAFKAKGVDLDQVMSLADSARRLGVCKAYGDNPIPGGPEDPCSPAWSNTPGDEPTCTTPCVNCITDCTTCVKWN